MCTFKKITNPLPEDGKYLTVYCKWGNITFFLEDGKYNIISSPKDNCRIVYHRGLLKIAYGRAWLKGHRTTLYIMDYDNAIKKLSDKTAESIKKVDDMSNKLTTMFCPCTDAMELEKELAELEAELEE